MLLFDTETTGLIDNSAIPLKSQPQIIELYALKLQDEAIRDLLAAADREGEVVTGPKLDQILDEYGEEWASLFHVKKMDDDAIKTHGITLEMLKGEPVFAERYLSLCDFFAGERTLIGHNLSYDRDMLLLELRRMEKVCAFPWPWRHICTVEATESLEGFRLSLSALYEKLFGESFPEAHRARNDVRAMARCVLKLIADGVIRI